MTQETAQEAAKETARSADEVPHRNPMSTADPRDRLSQRGKRLLWQLSDLGWFVVDLSIAGTSAIVASLLTPYADRGLMSVAHVSMPVFCFAYAVLTAVLANIAGLHDPRAQRRLYFVTSRVATTVSLAVMILTLELLIVHFLRVGRYILLPTAVFSFLGMTATRLLVWKFSKSLAQTVCFVGGDQFCFAAANFLAEHPRPFHTRTLLDYECRAGNHDLSQWAVEQEVDEIIFDAASDHKLDAEFLECLDYGIQVSSYSDFIEEQYSLVPVEQIDAKWLFSARVELAHPYYHGIKRALDIGLSTIGLLLTAPIILVVVILIKLESRGPAFYSQIRVGRFNRAFRIYKLRTMVEDAENGGAAWAQRGDARVTRVGRFLRKTRLDEVPQFWNILMGDMSMVGPRPERPEFVEMLSEKIRFYPQRHLVKPGLTGWAQINYPYGASVQDALNKLKYDLYYVKCSTIGLDLVILLRTIGAVMKGAQ